MVDNKAVIEMTKAVIEMTKAVIEMTKYWGLAVIFDIFVIIGQNFAFTVLLVLEQIGCQG